MEGNHLGGICGHLIRENEGLKQIPDSREEEGARYSRNGHEEESIGLGGLLGVSGE